MTGFFGKIPAAGDFVSWNLPRSFTDRWDRWFSAELLARPDEGPLDPRAWRFVVPAGVFGDQPVAGVWRMSEDRAGRRYPFVIAAVGAAPDPGDAWFEAVQAALDDAVDSFLSPDLVARRVGMLGAIGSGCAIATIQFWLDDWEVQEFRFSDARELAATGLAVMRRPRRVVEAF
ncbi:type VI secretion system-associated protein TagF [Amaricoccus sp.]|uniref:type VI secretion system-associated protein TagF n=1 Tax=Amaricoccus sp. TaxID=1872485 RepID=UPI001B6DC12E|nr:type VI secretion system-associated protein TagF [Amaricoccus sp.]MBP7241248.1 type VI secretion system-associated protein TagF [Amaricoccus sp.]